VSRADRPPPGIAAAFRLAAIDFYDHSLRLVAANTAWGVALVAVLGIMFLIGSLAGLAVLPLLAIPFAGVVRLAALIVREQDVVLSDAWSASRRFGLRALVVGIAVTLVAVALLTNLQIGLLSGGLGGGFLLALATWGLLVLWLLALPFWVLMVDPARERWPMRATLTLTAYLMLASPGRIIVVGVVQLALLIAATILFAALLTIALAYLALVTARALLPVADRLTGALAQRFPPLEIEPVLAESETEG
jgi:hypothetical protein